MSQWAEKEEIFPILVVVDDYIKSLIAGREASDNVRPLHWYYNELIDWRFTN